MSKLYSNCWDQFKDAIKNNNQIYINNFLNNEHASSFKEEFISDLINYEIDINNILNIKHEILNKPLAVYCVSNINQGHLNAIKNIVGKFNNSCLIFNIIFLLRQFIIIV